MAKFASPDVMDAALAAIGAANRLVVVAGQPNSFAEAQALRLAEIALAPADFVVASGSGGNRRLTVAARAGLTALASGTADHVALLDGAAGRLLYVTTCPALPLVAGAPVTIASWQIEIAAPV